MICAGCYVRTFAPGRLHLAGSRHLGQFIPQKTAAEMEAFEYMGYLLEDAEQYLKSILDSGDHLPENTRKLRLFFVSARCQRYSVRRLRGARVRFLEGGFQPARDFSPAMTPAVTTVLVRRREPSPCSCETDRQATRSLKTKWFGGFVSTKEEAKAQNE